MSEILLALCFIILGVISIMQTNGTRKLRRDLDTVRFAALDLINYLQDDVADLQQSLLDKGIYLRTDAIDERKRRMAMSPQDRYDESLARWNEVVERSERLWKDSSD